MNVIKTKLKRFSAAHRIIHGYVGKCNSLHGHDYGITVTFGATQLNPHGFVLDFNDVKKYCNNWVQEYWDHSVIVHENDFPLLEFVKKEKQKYFVLENYPNTTVECLTHFLFKQLEIITYEKIRSELNPYVQLLNVEVWETEDSSASFGLHGASLNGIICGTQ